MKKVTICLCSSRTLIDRDKVAEIYCTLSGAGYAVRIETDLCETAVTNPDEMIDIAASSVMACYPRAVAALFDRLGLKPLSTVNLRNNTPVAELLEVFSLVPAGDTEELKAEWNGLPNKNGQDAWYPLIDKKRCIECGKCHDFCLFGVYKISNGKIDVAQPQNCKNNCPACARICPSKAVIFPKYEKSPVNGGTDDCEQALTLDQCALYSSVLRERLAHRKESISLFKKDEK